MEYRTLGRSGCAVSTLALGTMTFGVESDEAVAHAQLDAFCAAGGGANDLGLSRGHLRRALEGSLRRLGVDHVDLYQVHAFDAHTPLEETLRCLDDAVRAGLVSYVG